MLVGRIAPAIYRRAIFRQRGLLIEVVVHAVKIIYS